MANSEQNNMYKMDTGTDKTCHGQWMSKEHKPGLVSVIIPTYNRAKYLVGAMDSVWNQTYRPIEMIVVDDGSTDNTKEVLAEWKKKSDNDKHFELRYFYQAKKDASAARNLGLIESRGEFIQFLDSDDIILPEKLTKQLDMLHHPDVDYVVCEIGIFSDNPALWVLKSNTTDVQHTLVQHIKNRVICTPTILMKRHIAHQVGPWNESLLKWQDWEYFARFFIHDFKGMWHKDILTIFRKHNENITNQPIALACDSMLDACHCVLDSVEPASTGHRKQVLSAIGWKILYIANALAAANEKHTSWKYVTIAHPLLTMRDRIRYYPESLIRIVTPTAIQNIFRYLKRQFRTVVK